MKRGLIAKTKLNDNQVRYTVRLESDPCDPPARMVQLDMLRTLASTPDLQLCGLTPFEKLTMRHTGGCWLIELEAVASE